MLKVHDLRCALGCIHTPTPTPQYGTEGFWIEVRTNREDNSTSLRKSFLYFGSLMTFPPDVPPQFGS